MIYHMLVLNETQMTQIERINAEIEIGEDQPNQRYLRAIKQRLNGETGKPKQ